MHNPSNLRRSQTQAASQRVDDSEVSAPELAKGHTVATSVDAIHDLDVHPEALGYGTGDAELDDPVPDAERLVAQAVALAGDDHDVATLVDRFWRFAPDEELIGFTAEEMLEAARAHRDLAQQRVPGELKLRIHEPDAEQHHTVVEIVTDDMPFLVDSVTALLNSRHLNVYLLVHPLVVVRREPLGRLTEVSADVEPDDAIAGDLVESWMRIEIDPVRDPAEREALRRELQRVLTDVREAVEDWPKMRQRALALADELAAARTSDNRPPVPEKDITDSVELLRWLAHDHFTFLGYREYRLVDVPTQPNRRRARAPRQADFGGQSSMEGSRGLQAIFGTGLGLLRSDSPEARALSSMTPEAQEKVLEKRLLIITKANSRATVHRSAYPDYIGFKIFDKAGEVVGERRFLGLFPTAAHRTSVQEMPVARRKVVEVVERSGLSLRSHSGKDLLQILETYPRDELFQIKTDDLYHAVISVLRMAGRRQLRVFLRRDAYRRFISCLIYLPRDRFTTQNRLRMQDILLRELNGVGVDHTTRVTESMLAQVHFIVRTDPNNPPGDIDADLLAEELADATRLWDDDYRLVLERKLGDEQAKYLFARYADAFPEGYKDGHTPYEAMKDLGKLELLEEPGQLEMHLFRKQAPPRPYAARAADADEAMDVRFKVYRYGEPMMLSAVLPVLHSLGVKAVDEHPYEVERVDGRIWLYDFGLELPERHQDLAEVRPHVENAFAAAWRGEAEVDGFNELVLRAGLTWRQVVVLRTYAKYLRQAGTVFSQEYMEQTFIAYPQVTRLLIELFETRLVPGSHSAQQRRRRMAGLVKAIDSELRHVASTDQNRILRSYLTLIQATLRTSFYQKRVGGRPEAYVAFKLDPQAIPELPAPRPTFEIFVYSPRFEGVHLRFGPVASGGIHWSDRREDFRTEVLGLVAAQMVKNATIVPAGAKGGFVLKQKPGDRDEAVICYKEFVSALLDVTDNIVSGEIVPPEDVVRHDADDPYLMLTADATFMQQAAVDIATKRGFWLAEVFAPPPSDITAKLAARGAFESIARHFRIMGLDPQSGQLSVAIAGSATDSALQHGIPLLGPIRLLAAFDEQYVFLDPDPDPIVAAEERRRLAGQPGATWADYDPDRISEGGGTYARTATSIKLSQEARQILGLTNDITQLAPEELVKAILTAPVDLLWIAEPGTRIQASLERREHADGQVGLAAGVDANGLRCRAICESAAGLTAQARQEYARGGHRVWTSFVDAAAPIFFEDRLHNSQILVNLAVDSKRLDARAGRALLATFADEVATRAPHDCRDQVRAISDEAAESTSLLSAHRGVISDLEASGMRDSAVLLLGSSRDLDRRALVGEGLTAPELAMLRAAVLTTLKADLASGTITQEAWATKTLLEYFPPSARKLTSRQVVGHPLRHHIVAAELSREITDRAGLTFVHRMRLETGSGCDDIVRAYIVARDVYDLPSLWQETDDAEKAVVHDLQRVVHARTSRLLQRVARWLLVNRHSPIDVSAELNTLKAPVRNLLASLDLVSSETRGARRQKDVVHLTTLDVPPLLAQRLATLNDAYSVVDIVGLALGLQTDPVEVAEAYFLVADRIYLDNLLARVAALSRSDPWDSLSRAALRYGLYDALTALTDKLLSETPSDARSVTAEKVKSWEQANSATIARVRNYAHDPREEGEDLAHLSMLLRQVRALVRTTAAKKH
ncbi:NAD-glutamate dehydrogenase [Micromonospora tulbaghiae]|uniref:NAD-glutamate dehydrogenase n=1 Tax=Micromonospora tulbaghiae TaxID=479978 RepID=UPI0029C1BB91|nr:NAD-glutamate dehydrogenase domain-containing protein [Micromonospora tulbaghiae]MDX5461299.1 NAD-glutamate dehydrogenase [Micromonospora tulbaghiae]